MILAAGRGQRMMPLTKEQPKPMLKVLGQPLIEHHIDALKQAGITNIVINLAWQGDKIVEYFGDGSRFGVSIEYSHEPEGGLETAGGIIAALPLLTEQFLVVNGDVFTDYDFSSLTQLHLEDNEAHIVLVENPAHNPDGDFSLNHSELQTERYTFSGVSRFGRDFFNEYPAGTLRLGPLLKEQLVTGRVSTELYLGQWDDIGTPERLIKLNESLAKSKLDRSHAHVG